MSTKNNEGENLSRIRDILFGEDLETIDKQFEDFKTTTNTAFEALKAEYEKRVSTLELRLAEKTKEVEQKQEETKNTQLELKDDLKKDIQQINLEVIKEKANLSKIIIEKDESLKNRVSDFEIEINKNIETIKSNFNSRLEEFEAKMINKESLANFLSAFAEELKK